MLRRCRTSCCRCYLHQPSARENCAAARRRCVPAPSLSQGLLGPKSNKIIDREDDYRRRRLNRIISPDRNDAFQMGDKTPDTRHRTYADIMRQQQLEREQANTLQNIRDKQRQEAEAAAAGAALPPPPAAGPAPSVGEKRRNRWDQSAAEP